VNRRLVLGMYFNQCLFPGNIPNGAFRSASIDRATDTSFGSLRTKWLSSDFSDRAVGGGEGFAMGLTVDILFFSGFVALAPDRKESEIFD
jgi:hypothetical protein